MKLNWKIKGQIWTHDFLLMMVILILIIVLFYTTWNSIAFSWNTQYAYNVLWSRANDVTAALVTTSGYPYSWEKYGPDEEEDIEQIGFAYSRNHLSTFKISRAQQWSEDDYSEFKERLGSPQYEVHVSIFDPDENQTLVTFGRAPLENVSQARITRMAIFNGTVVHFTVNLWEE